MPPFPAAAAFAAPTADIPCERRWPSAEAAAVSAGGAGPPDPQKAAEKLCELAGGATQWAASAASADRARLSAAVQRALRLAGAATGSVNHAIWHGGFDCNGIKLMKDGNPAAPDSER